MMPSPRPFGRDVDNMGRAVKKLQAAGRPPQPIFYAPPSNSGVLRPAAALSRALPYQAAATALTTMAQAAQTASRSRVRVITIVSLLFSIESAGRSESRCVIDLLRIYSSHAAAKHDLFAYAKKIVPGRPFFKRLGAALAFRAVRCYGY